MAKKKKRAAKKAARSKAAKKRPLGAATRVRVREPDLDIVTIPHGAVSAADQVEAVPPGPEAQDAVVQATQQVVLALPSIEQEATRQGGAGAITVPREVIWLVGPARLPRSAIVGRALSDDSAFSEARSMTYLRIAQHIRNRGPHHLRDEILQTLTNYDQTPARNARTLAGLFQRAVSYLSAMGYVQAGDRRGLFLVGEGPQIFENWPDWSREDLEAEPLRRQQTPRTTPPDAPLPPPAAAGQNSHVPASSAGPAILPPDRARRRLQRLDGDRDQAQPELGNRPDRSGGVDP